MNALRKFLRTLWKLLKQASIPATLSASYATWVYSERPDGASLTDWITSFAGAFFFSMWLLGQFLRTSKQISDSDNFDKLTASLADINASIRELKAIPPVAAGAAFASELITEAQTVAANGHVLAGLLQAGLAFEQALQQKARRMGLDRGNFRGMPALIGRIEKELGPAAGRELQILWKLRNQIVHAEPEAADELQSQPELISSFASGIDLLGSNGDSY